MRIFGILLAFGALVIGIILIVTGWRISAGELVLSRADTGNLIITGGLWAVWFAIAGFITSVKIRARKLGNMKISMSDGRDIKLTELTSKPGFITVWQAEVIYAQRKMHYNITRAVRGFGQTVREAIVQLYGKLDDAGELEDNLIPCQLCGKGYRVVSIVDTHIPHGDKCPAMSDTGETDG